MVSDMRRISFCVSCWAVLILVLMEYGLGPKLADLEEGTDYVLILVLMEYGLGQRTLFLYGTLIVVLILVLMEYGLGHFPMTCLYL